MWNPLSLHSGSGFLLFLSLVPVALSLPAGGGNGWSPYDSQSHELAQNPPGISSTSRILPDDERDRFVWDSALQDLPRRESLIPPPLPPSHAGWYPSSSEALRFLEPGPSYNHADELRQKAEGALQRQNEPDLPLHGGAATAKHSRVSNKRASS